MKTAIKQRQFQYETTGNLILQTVNLSRRMIKKKFDKFQHLYTQKRRFHHLREQQEYEFKVDQTRAKFPKIF